QALAPRDTGPGVRAWIKQVLNQDLVFQHIKVIYPTAPARPYTPMRGALSTVWFDRWKISNECPEHIETIDSMCQVLTNVIDDEVKNGISKNRIILGGFSMGGGMAMHLAYRYHQDVAGVFALSSFLNKTSAVYQVSKCQSFLQIPFGVVINPRECPALRTWVSKISGTKGLKTTFIFTHCLFAYFCSLTAITLCKVCQVCNGTLGN
uniref:palmitoyl-protein hydrolase n=1 Tax=Chrysemys picta bellii TaxID=8478 RepID=A0A8C3HGE3_CHRPI